MRIKPPPGWDLQGYPEPPLEVRKAWDLVNTWATQHRTYPGAGRLLVVSAPHPYFLDLDDALQLAASVLEAALTSDPSRLASPDSPFQVAHLETVEALAADFSEALAFLLKLVQRLYSPVPFEQWDGSPKNR